MKYIQSSLLTLLLVLIIVFSGCKKESSTVTTTPDPSVQSNAMLKQYQAASNTDALLVTFHQHANITGNHDSCYLYWSQFSKCDSLFSLNFYDYCRTIYANHGGHNYGMEGWHWDSEGEMENHDNWQCGLDTLQFQNWHGSGNCSAHDSLMHQKMQGYGMMGNFSTQANQCYDNMQALRSGHYHNHNYHW